MKKDQLKDKRVQEILQGLTKGKTREELAIEFNHANYKTLDIYMRRKGFKWDTNKQNYFLEEKTKEVAHVDTSRAAQIKRLIAQQEELDLTKIAKIMNFKDYIEMGNYMKSKQYEWSREKGNYIKCSTAISEEKTSRSEDSLIENNQTTSFEKETPSELITFLPLLDLLQRNEKRLVELLQPYSQTGQIPRYTISGVAKTKTVQMIHSLDQMVTNFANEHNITQRDLFEVALIDFFKRYGYEKEVEGLFR